MTTSRADEQGGSEKKSIHYSRMSTAARINPQALIYDVYRCPAKMEEAEMHRRATTFAVADSTSSKVCPCCKRICEVKEFNFFGNTNDINDVCPTVSVYFYFIVFAIFIQFLIFMLNSVVLLVRSPELRECFFTKCPENTDAMISLYQQSPAFRVLACVCLGLMIASRHIFYAYVRERYVQGELARVSADDFSLMLTVPEYKSEAQIKQDLDALIASHHLSCTVVKINKVYDLRKYIEFLNSVTEKDQTLRRMRHAGHENTIPYRKCIDAKGFAVESLELIVNRMQTLEGEVCHFANLAFITFRSNYECMTMQLLLKNKFSMARTKLRGYAAEEADEPENYIWENFGTKIDQKLKMRILALGSTLICWAATFVILTLFKYGVGSSEALKKIPSVLVNFGGYLIITAMHIIVGNVMGFFTQKEQFVRLSDQLTSTAWKGFLISFVNTAISIVVSSCVNSGNEMVEAVWKGGGMVPTTMLVMTFDVVYSTFMTLFGPDVIRSLIRSRRLTFQVQKEGSTNKVMQIDLNKALENGEFNVAGHYTGMFYVLSMVFFYHHVAPYAAVIGIVALVLKFILTRFLLFYRSTSPRNFSFEFTHHMFVMLDFCFLIYAASTAFFQTVFLNWEPWFKAGMVIAGSVNFIYGVLTLYSTTVKSQVAGQELLFENYSAKLTTDYDRQNPITAGKALQTWIESIDLTKADGKTLRAVQLNTAVQTKVGQTQNFLNRVNVPKKTAAKAPRIDTMWELNNGTRIGQNEGESSQSAPAAEFRSPKSLLAAAQHHSAQISQAGTDNIGETQLLKRDIYHSSA